MNPQVLPLKKTSTNLVKAAKQQMQSSTRSYRCILKLVQSIADLVGKADIQIPHIAEAIQYRPKQQI